MPFLVRIRDREPNINMKYLEVDYKFRSESDEETKVTFFIPISFIENGDLEGWSLRPDNFLGVNLKKLWKYLCNNNIKQIGT